MTRFASLALPLVGLACGRIGFDEQISPAGIEIDGSSGDPDLSDGGNGGGGGGTDGATADAFAASCDPPCAEDEYCSTPVGMCEADGTCAPVPTGDTCLDGFLCGCDGMTYSDSCGPPLAGVGVRHLGACADEEPE